ncbi:chemotaxis protein CheC [Candidatus Woesearchaeota archaeon]|nr:chemotaxis protein CheC [Candidatus Woesearchaeota archaeon]
MDKLLNLNEMDMDTLREVGNIGVGNAATALSKVLNKKIKIVVPETKFIPLNQFSQEFGSPDRLVTAVYFKIQGDVAGESVFLFTHEDTLKLIDLLMGRELGSTKIIDDLNISALKEMTNIFSGAYLTALSNLINLKILPSIPHIANDMLQSLFDFVLAKVSTYATNILTVKTKINIEGNDIGGDFMLFFEVESYKRILEALTNKYGIERQA